MKDEYSNAIGRHLGVPVTAMSPEDAREHFGWFAMFAGMDIPASSARTKALLGWEPDGPTLLQDMNDARYFRDP
ncbi:MAG TPA: hypothetical protein VIJ55_01825 [Acetobacteraceae bacterium]